MNNKCFRTTVSAFALILAFSGTNTTNAWAEDVVYNGTQEEYDRYLGADGKTFVVPTNDIQNNTLTIDNPYNLTGDDYKAPYDVAGASGGVQGASDNTVNIKGTARINRDVYGAVVDGGDYVAERNTVIITGGQIDRDVIGGFSKQGSANNNIVVQSGGTVVDNLTGGQGATGASNNSVIIRGGTETGIIFGGSSKSGYIKNNSVLVEGGSFGIGSDIYGGYSSGDTGIVDGNTVTMTTGEIRAVVSGGWTYSKAAVINNKVIIYGSAKVGTVMGGRASSSSSGNSVSMSGTSYVTYQVYGGYNVGQNGAAKNNLVKISGDADVGQVLGGVTTSRSNGIAQGNQVVIESGHVRGINAEGVIGGQSQGGSASQNTVKMSGGTIEGHIFGGRSLYNKVDNPSAVSVSGNQVIITGGMALKNVIGGNADTSGNVTDNVVTISGDTTIVNGYLTGGFSGSGDVSGNTVNVSGGSVSEYVHGGDAINGRADRNIINVTGGSVGSEIFGGRANKGADSNQVFVSDVTANGQIIAGYSTNSSVTNNVVVVKNSTVPWEIYAGYSSTTGNAEGNSLTISDHASVHDVISGYAKNGLAINNTLVVSSNSTVDTFAMAGVTENGNASGNSLIVKNGAQLADYGGGGKTLIGDATNNSVSIEDATIDGNVYGGYTSNGNATNNLITLTGGNVKIGGTVYGGFFDGETRSSADVFTGNTLKLVHFRGDLVGIENVENYNWVLPKDVVNNVTLVHITGENPVNLANTTHKVAIDNDGSRLRVDDKITLIDKTANGPLISHIEVKQGNFIIYDMKAEQSGNGYVLTTLNSRQIGEEKPDDNDSNANGESDNRELAGRLNPQTKAFSEGRAASLGFLNQGADLIANAGIRSAKSSVAEAGNKPWQMNLMPFFVIDGSSNRYKTGSHADVDGFNMAVGLATGFELADKHPVTLGAFFEYGRGTYDTYNSFANYASVHGDGDTHYTGGGVLGRIDFAGTGLGWVNKLEAGQADGLYAEASFRAGHIDTDFDTDDLLGEFGQGSDYDSGADYYGLHGGVGYVMNFDERNSVDVYGRYFWTRIDSETVDVGRDRLHFDEADSSRLRIGTRYTMIYNQQLKPYVGIAYDHEFDGEVAARAYGLKLDKPSLEGDTGIVEAGISMKPVSTIDALSVDVTGQGFIGRREGGGGGIKIKYQF